MPKKKAPADDVIYNGVTRRLGGRPADFRALAEAARETAQELGLTVHRVMEVMDDEREKRERSSSA